MKFFPYHLDIISCAFGAIILILLVIKKETQYLNKNLDINRVENIFEKLKVSENIEKLKAENRLLTSFIKEKTDNINNLNSELEEKNSNRKQSNA